MTVTIDRARVVHAARGVDVFAQLPEQVSTRIRENVDTRSAELPRGKRSPVPDSLTSARSAMACCGET